MWAFAAKVAVEYTTERNNYVCAEKPQNWLQTGSVVGGAEDCIRNIGEEDCKVKKVFGSLTMREHLGNFSLDLLIK